MSSSPHVDQASASQPAIDVDEVLAARAVKKEQAALRKKAAEERKAARTPEENAALAEKMSKLR